MAGGSVQEGRMNDDAKPDVVGPNPADPHPLAGHERVGFLRPLVDRTARERTVLSSLHADSSVPAQGRVLDRTANPATPQSFRADKVDVDVSVKTFHAGSSQKPLRRSRLTTRTSPVATTRPGYFFHRASYCSSVLTAIRYWRSRRVPWGRAYRFNVSYNEVVHEHCRCRHGRGHRPHACPDHSGRAASRSHPTWGRARRGERGRLLGHPRAGIGRAAILAAPAGGRA